MIEQIKAMAPLLLHLLQLKSKLVLLWLVLAASVSASPPISLPGCADHCGHIKIPYPFGIGPKCFHDKHYEIICKNFSSSPPKPFLRKPYFEVQEIKLPSDYDENPVLTVLTPALSLCSSSDGVGESVDLRGSPFRLSRWLNVLMVQNCGGSVVLKNSSDTILTGCASYCSNTSTVRSTNNNITCYGIGCCQASLLPPLKSDFLNRMQGLDFYQISLDQRAATTSSNSCNLIAALIETSSAQKYAEKLSPVTLFPTILEWNPTFIPPYSETGDPEDNTCFYEESSYRCTCGWIYEGNPYLPYGCQVVRECQNCSHHCGFNYTSSTYYCEKRHLFNRASILGFSIGMGVVLFFLGCYGLYRLAKWRKEIRQKAEYFKRNGGLLLQQQLSSSDGVVEKTKVFAITELEHATDNFNENRILGQGGQGTVYKGMLTDGTIVAIKKSKQVDKSQLEQFINEIIILSQINHRNVVKLIGCCLETEVPLLVHEFIPNGTLYQHIHDPSDDFHITWKMRLQIAAESAGSLAYLHSSLSAPVYHRDIKSSNILLDDKYRAKVSDFGTSRAITIEQTHLTTCVQGTYGYLDPEYFQSNQFTEKSDVYSFGVVLVELITGKKPIRPTESGGWISLATEFLAQMENCALFDMLDARISDEGKEEEFTAVADLAKKCLNMNGKRRPTMKEVAMVVDDIRSPPVPHLKEPTCVKSECEITEIGDLHSNPFSTGPHISDSDSSKHFFTGVQPVRANT